ncbi:hypothetical protein B0H14DRAFT_3466332 [Mycena olivaceomarginata]|nr:hypothetical protein B0H14DRAFT_3466332 [Mycena olivaceomarginata]
MTPPPQANAFKTHIQEDFGSVLGVRLFPDEIACIFVGKRLHTVPFTAVREGYPYLYLFSLDQLAERRLNSEYRKMKVADRAYCVVYKAAWGAGGQAYASSIEEVFARVQQ